MPISDNLIFKVKAEAGQSVITDALNAITFSGGGTATLVNDGTYGYLWRITGGALSAVLSGHGFGNWTETGAKATTLAARFRVTSRAANYTRFIQIGTDASNGIFFGNAGSASGSMRGGVCIAGSSVSTPSVLTYTTGDVVTLLTTFTETNAASDPISAWKGTTGRSGTAADATSSVAVSVAARAIAAAVLTVATETLDLIDLAYWNRGLSDAEAAAVADDIRGQLYSGGMTHNITAANSNQANAASVGSVNQTHKVGVLNSHQTNVGSTGSISQSSTTFVAGSNSTQANTVSPGAVLQSSAGTINIPEFRDWGTGNLLPGETGVTVWVNDDVTGQLVAKLSGQTSHPTTAICSVTHPSFVSGTNYHVRVKLENGAQASWTLTAI